MTRVRPLSTTAGSCSQQSIVRLQRMLFRPAAKLSGDKAAACWLYLIAQALASTSWHQHKTVLFLHATSMFMLDALGILDL